MAVGGILPTHLVGTSDPVTGKKAKNSSAMHYYNQMPKIGRVTGGSNHLAYRDFLVNPRWIAGYVQRKKMSIENAKKESASFLTCIHAYIRHCMHTYMHTCMQKCFKKNLSSALLARCCAKWPNAVLFEKKGGATGAPFSGDPPRVRQVKRFLKKKRMRGQPVHPGVGTPPFLQKPYVLPSGRRGDQGSEGLREL